MKRIPLAKYCIPHGRKAALARRVGLTRQGIMYLLEISRDPASGKRYTVIESDDQARVWIEERVSRVRVIGSEAEGAKAPGEPREPQQV